MVICLSESETNLNKYIFSQTVHIYNSLHLAQHDMYGYLPMDIARSKMWTVLQEQSSGKTVSFKEQIMS